MTDKQFRKLMKDVATDMINDGLEIGDCAYDVAESLLFMNPELREYVKRQLPKDGDVRLFVAESIG